MEYPYKTHCGPLYFKHLIRNNVGRFTRNWITFHLAIPAQFWPDTPESWQNSLYLDGWYDRVRPPGIISIYPPKHHSSSDSELSIKCLTPRNDLVSHSSLLTFLEEVLKSLNENEEELQLFICSIVKSAIATLRCGSVSTTIIADMRPTFVSVKFNFPQSHRSISQRLKYFY